MKKLIILILIFVSNSSKAQTSVYHPFPDSNAIWNIHYFEPCGFYFDQQEKLYSYLIQGDTSISGNTYHKIYVPAVVMLASGGCGTSGILPGYYAGAFRQE